MRRTRKILNFALIGFLLSSCAIKRPRTDFSQFQETEKAPYSTSSYGSENELDFSITPGLTANTTDKAERKRPGITLVLGGAGVASFATVGLLKRLQKERVQIDGVIASGWPALFALGFGYLKSVHDLEWFSMRLKSEDFKKSGRKPPKDNLEVSGLIESFFKNKNLEDSKIPLLIVAANSEEEKLGVYDSGSWKTAFLKTVSFPGLYRKIGNNPLMPSSYRLEVLGVEEARKRQASMIIAVEMYSDALDFIPKDAFSGSVKKSLKEEFSKADLHYSVKLNRNPLDFSQKRSAILSGQKVAQEIIKEMSK
jgi:NTE family protein